MNSVLVIFSLVFGLSNLILARNPYNQDLSPAELDEISKFASNAYRNANQNSFSHYVGRRVKTPREQMNQHPFAVLMKRPPRNELLHTSASNNNNNYYSFQRPAISSNHILPLPFFGSFLPKRTMGPKVFTFSHPPTIISSVPDFSLGSHQPNLQFDHQRKKAILSQENSTNVQEAQASQNSKNNKPQNVESSINKNVGTSPSQKQIINNAIPDKYIFQKQQQYKPQFRPSFDHGPVQSSILNSLGTFMSFMRPPPPPIRISPSYEKVIRQLPQKVTMVYHKPYQHQGYLFHSGPTTPNLVKIQSYRAAPIPQVLPNSNDNASINSETVSTSTAKSTTAQSSSIIVTKEQPNEDVSKLNSTQVSTPVIFNSARIPQDVAISSSGSLSSNQSPLKMTPEEQRNVFTAAADSSLVLAPSFDSNVSSNEDDGYPKSVTMITRTLPNGKRVRLRKIRKDKS